MIGFRDMTFCTYDNDCAKAKKCPRVLTPEIREAARKWWGNAEAPIIMFFEKPQCHEKVEEKK